MLMKLFGSCSSFICGWLPPLEEVVDGVFALLLLE